MKVASVDVLQCEGGTRTLNFVKVQTDDGNTAGRSAIACGPTRCSSPRSNT